METLKFKLGDKVKWQSQSGGFWKEKRGTIVEVVGIGSRPRHAIYGGTTGMGRIYESYVVELEREPKGAAKLKPRYYWPVVNALTRA